jgi:hypothetical protein
MKYKYTISFETEEDFSRENDLNKDLLDTVSKYAVTDLAVKRQVTKELKS